MPKLIIILLSVCFLLPIPVESETLSKKKFQKEIRHYIEHHKHQIIREFIEMLSIPNVSGDRINIRKNAELLKLMMEKRGISAKVMETGGNPVVYGEVIVPGATWTLGFYAHYDGQPVDPSKWTDTKPFEPVFRPGKLEAGTDFPKPISLILLPEKIDDDWRIYARSTSDDKAAIIALLSAVSAIKSAGFPLENNIKFIFEGEEEAGSTNLRPFLERHRNMLKSDVLFMCDGPVYYSGNPTLFFGVRGIATMEITVYGPNTRLHSGHYGNWAPNPAIRLAHLLASMKDENNRVIIKGFYDSVVPLSESERNALQTVPSFDAQIMELYGFARPEGRSTASLLEALLLPSLNINGIQSGWVGAQARTIIPSKAVASIDLRLVKANEPLDMIRKVIIHIKAQGYHIVEEDPDHQTRMKYPLIAKVVTLEDYKASRTSMDLLISKIIIDTLKNYFDEDLVIIPSLGGSLPIFVFNDILGIPTIGVPIANHDNNQHQPDENIRIGHLWQGIETFAALMSIEKD